MNANKIFIDSNDLYIIIGKYKISKVIFMSEPVQLTVTNTETNENNLIYDYKLFKLLRNEGLDTEPVDEYFDKINALPRTPAVP